MGLGQLRNTVEQQLAPIGAEHFDRDSPTFTLADDLAVVEEDKVLLRILESWIEEQRFLGFVAYFGRWSKAIIAWHEFASARSFDREALPLRAGAFGAAWQQVLPLIREPPVVVATERAVEIEGTQGWAEVLDLERSVAKARL
jgi:hypothetical protein